ncbi:MAG: PDZ domain-containing protein [Acidobacteriota bacterium]|nr:PDZ domain-containing protein [Acidobacteriota bacterium]
MAANFRYWSFVAVLGAGVAAAVSILGAQEPRDSRTGRELADRQVLMLEGPGSRLGVMVRDLEPAEVAKAPSGGVTIDEVTPDSPAEKAGLRAGDVVIEFDGERVRSARQFSRLVQETPEGRAVPLAVRRDGQRQTMTATPEARAFSWNMDLDGDQIQREVERGLDGLREFRMNPPAFNFRFDGRDRLLGLDRRGRLGVTLDTLTDQLAGYFGAAEGGALVTSVREDSPAARAGLKAGDVITSINGDRVHDAGDVRDGISRAADGEVSIGYLRDRQAGTATATLEAREEGSRRRSVRPARFMRPA